MPPQLTQGNLEGHSVAADSEDVCVLLSLNFHRSVIRTSRVGSSHHEETKCTVLMGRGRREHFIELQSTVTLRIVSVLSGPHSIVIPKNSLHSLATVNQHCFEQCP